MQIFDRHQDLLDWIESRGHVLTTLGHAPDGAPIVSVKTGGGKEPAIFISDGDTKLIRPSAVTAMMMSPLRSVMIL